MAEITLTVEPGRSQGSSASRRLRTAGKIPGVIYGHGMEPVAVAVLARDLRRALSTDAGARALLTVDLEGKSHLAIAKVLQRHPVRQTVMHVDFQVVRRDEVIATEVRLVFVGEALGVHRAGGVVDQELLSLQIKAKPGDVPPSIEVDISELEIGDSIRVSDIVLPAGVVAETDLDAAVAIAHVARAAEVELVTEAAAEAAAEGAAEGAVGEAEAPADEG